MTEEQWLACGNTRLMLGLLQTQKVSDRKARLFACACCRHAWSALPHEDSRKAVEAAERFADGLIRDRERIEARNAPGVWAAVKSAAARNGKMLADAVHCSWYVRISVANAWSQKCHREGDHEEADKAHHAGCAAEEAAQSELIREVFGNPFRPCSLDPAWRTPVVVALAQGAYDERALPSGELDVSRLAVLSDALEELGCTAPDVLTHLRSPGPHVRGCWALDLILGKS